MSHETTSFVVRFVREMSEDQSARWRGLIQHVQSGAEQNFATFAQAVQFMQGRVVEQTVESLKDEGQMSEHNPFGDLGREMTKLWGDWGPRMAEVWSQAAEQMMQQSAAFRSQVDQAVGNTLKAWGMAGAEQGAILARLDQLSEQITGLTARVEALEKSKEKKGGKSND